MKSSRGGLGRTFVWHNVIPAGRIRVYEAIFLLALAVMTGSTEQGWAEAIRLDALKIPAVNSGSGGPAAIGLEAIVLRPDDGLPHPLAVLNHGSPRLASARPMMSAYGMWEQALAFARRGWVAVAFLRRGYGQSGGAWAEDYGPCANPDYATAGRAGASDIAAVAKFMTAQPYVSKTKWISVGFSAGGFATVALTADPPDDLAAAIGFAPGRGSTSSDTVCGEERLISVFAGYGRTSRIPLLWVSADNDHFFGPRLVSQLTAAFSRAGGNATFIKVPPFGRDGHQLFSAAEGVPIWSPIVDRFLLSNNLKLLDGPVDASDPVVPAPSVLDGRGREELRKYLESAPNKAFAIAGNAHFGWASGRRTVDEARKDALASCEPGAFAKCAIVNVNNRLAP